MTRLEEIVEEYYPKFEGMEEEFMMTRDDFQMFCHSMLSGGISMSIRNSLGLWDAEGEDHKYFKNELSCEHPDDMSSLIIGKIWDKHRNK